jgi:micrococcal nuclease
MGISNALYFSAEPEGAGSPDLDKRNSNPGGDTPESPEQAGKQGGAERPDQERRDADQAKADAKAKPGAAGSGNAEASQPSVTVARAVDGDTIEISPAVDGKDTVRLIGIDAPEVGKPGCGPQPLSQEAAEHASLWEGQRVLLEFDRERTDEQGRLLAYVHNPTTGKMMNVDMIQSGYAQLYIVAPNTEHEDELREAQDRAKTASAGFGADVWSLPPAKDAQLADHGNAIGEGSGACPPERRSAIIESASPSASPSPSPGTTQKLAVPNAQNPSVPASASPSASPSAGGSPSSASPPAGGG